MAAVTDKRSVDIHLTGVGRNIFRSNHRLVSPLTQLKISPHSSVNGEISSDLPSPIDDSESVKAKATSLAQDYINYKLNPEPEEAKDEIARTLRRVGDEMVDRHQTVVNAMSKRLHLSSAASAGEHPNATLNQRKFLLIVNEICQDGQDNWGRIVTIYVLGSILALNDLEHEGGSDIDNIINYVGNYIGTQKREWIEQNGGWDGFMKFFNNGAIEEKKVWKGLLYAVGLGALATSLAVRK